MGPNTPDSAPLNPGMAVIHSNRLEHLRDLVVTWIGSRPLAPLENEVILVQSNGMAQWLKQSIADSAALGIAAAIRTQLPAQFLWSAYRSVLGQEALKEQRLGKSALIWRLYRLLPKVVRRPGFAELDKFLRGDEDQRKRHQLAERLADLYDQYQVYRADWLAGWAAGKHDLRDAKGARQPLAEAQRWQADLWLALLEDLGDTSDHGVSRDQVHARFLDAVDQLGKRPGSLPRRLIVFGLSSLPQQSLEALAKLGRFCQIVLCVHNPCQYYWADIIEDKDLFKAEHRRQRHKAGQPSRLPGEVTQFAGNPLLAAWGKQGRDYIRLLDHFDNSYNYKDWGWPNDRVDLFESYADDGQARLLQQVQQAILDLTPAPEPDARTVLAVDTSIAFHIAHSPQREVEILHDQLLERFNTADQHGLRLSPREVIVMVPDIDTYAPHIRAVFGQVDRNDARYIPFSLADQRERGQNPLLVALETLLKLPESRFPVSELLGLLEAPALRKRFGIDESEIPLLHRWIEGAGVRWGLSGRQRAQVVKSMPAELEANTWQFGLDRMLLGYAVGAGDTFHEIEPYEEIGGLEAQVIGGLSRLLERLEHYANLLSQDAGPATWKDRLSHLLQDFFEDAGERDRKTRDLLIQSLHDWAGLCAQAGLTPDDALPLTVVREAWLSAVDEPNLNQRFLGGRVNFCTLMPMRAIPFRIVCLLGMNDGDYPRTQQAHSFDLMRQAGHYRPGDRSRRQDDQYLFLEALLSAREHLYVSWVGRNVRDNSKRPPSVLVGQLRDYLVEGWRLEDDKASLLDALTVTHPLQSFSMRYLEGDRRLFTYAREWHATAESTIPVRALSATPDAAAEPRVLTLEQLATFLRYPLKTYCNQALDLRFDDDDQTSEDTEPFTLDGLETYHIGSELLTRFLAEESEKSGVDPETGIRLYRDKLKRQGKLPLGGFSSKVYDAAAEPARQAWDRYLQLTNAWPDDHSRPEPKIELDFASEGRPIRLEGALRHVRITATGESTLVHIVPRKLFKDENREWHLLLKPWLQQVAGCAHGLKLSTHLIGTDAVTSLPAIHPDLARQWLDALLSAWHAGMDSPPPVDCKTAFAWLETGDLGKTRSTYEGDDWNNGQVDYDAYLARFFPTFAQLENGGFIPWAEQLYGKLHHNQVIQEVSNGSPQ